MGEVVPLFTDEAADWVRLLRTDLVLDTDFELVAVSDLQLSPEGVTLVLHASERATCPPTRRPGRKDGARTDAGADNGSRQPPPRGAELPERER